MEGVERGKVGRLSVADLDFSFDDGRVIVLRRLAFCVSTFWSMFLDAFLVWRRLRVYDTRANVFRTLGRPADVIASRRSCLSV